MGVLAGCKPRDEVLKGDLDDAIFAADFGDLRSGRAPKVYGDPATFFHNTHPAKQLGKIVLAVFERLAAKKEGGTTVRLSTGFGGGKTHTPPCSFTLEYGLHGGCPARS
jgi:predicted AAA+ superfamily ATPase